MVRLEEKYTQALRRIVAEHADAGLWQPVISGSRAADKAAFREATRHGFINNPEQWFEPLRARNLTTRTYMETVAAKIYEVIKCGFPPVDQLIELSRDGDL